MKSKLCVKCNIEKSLDKFYKRILSKDGYENRCIQCKKIYCKIRHNNNKNDINKSNKI